MLPAPDASGVTPLIAKRAPAPKSVLVPWPVFEVAVLPDLIGHVRYAAARRHLDAGSFKKTGQQQQYTKMSKQTRLRKRAGRVERGNGKEAETN